jgi:hypothetical protein
VSLIIFVIRRISSRYDMDENVAMVLLFFVNPVLYIVFLRAYEVQ